MYAYTYVVRIAYGVCVENVFALNFPRVKETTRIESYYFHNDTHQNGYEDLPDVWLMVD